MMLSALALTANAQYWQLANQASNMIQTAVTAGVRYKGYADVSYMAGVGNKRADILDISTTQGVKMSDSFFMGAGLGVDIMFSHVNDGYNPGQWGDDHSFTKTAVLIPLYTDFRLNLGGKAQGAVGFFGDLRLGAAFLTGSNYIQVGDGYLTNSECFYLKPTLGMRIPLSMTNSKVALNIGVSYQLLTNSSWYVNTNSTSLSSLGVNLGIEW